MNDEIKEILDIEKYRNKEGYVENINLSPDEIHRLLDYITNLQTIEQQYSAILSENAELENKITNLQEENKRLQKNLDFMTDRNNEKQEVIDELEKWVKENNINNRDIYGYEMEDKVIYLEDFLDKLKELKGESN